MRTLAECITISRGMLHKKECMPLINIYFIYFFFCRVDDASFGLNGSFGIEPFLLESEEHLPKEALSRHPDADLRSKIHLRVGRLPFWNRWCRLVYFLNFLTDVYGKILVRHGRTF